jgi:hypothetical protein
LIGGYASELWQFYGLNRITVELVDVEFFAHCLNEIDARRAG